MLRHRRRRLGTFRPDTRYATDHTEVPARDARDILVEGVGHVRSLEPAKQRVVAAGMAILLLLAAVGIGTAAAQDKGATKAENSAAKSTESVAVNETATPSSTPTSSETDQAPNAENSATTSAEVAAVNEKKPATRPRPKPPIMSSTSRTTETSRHSCRPTSVPPRWRNSRPSTRAGNRVRRLDHEHATS